MHHFKLWTITAIFLMFSSISTAQTMASIWNGEYFYEGVYGKTFGGSPVIRDYTVRINNRSCEIEISGFQTSDDIICTQIISENSVTMLFKSYASGDEKNIHGVEVYHRGQPLLKFVNLTKRSKTIMFTYWLGITDPYNNLPKPGVYFKRLNN